MAWDKVAHGRASDRQEPDDDSVDEALRQIGADILNEPVPERLLRVLRPKGQSDQPSGRDEPAAGPSDDRMVAKRPRRG